MKKLLLLFITLITVQAVSAQVFERRYLEHQNRNRTYLIYVPSTYDPNSDDKVPLIFVYHGINATDENIAGVGMNEFAEVHNFIVIYPQAAQVEFGFIAWNCGTLLASNIDDTGFFEAILDRTMMEYDVDEKRVYACGFSMGGMMANRLGCERSDRIAAIASVSGPITQYIYANCEPVRSVPYMHFHGIADETVPYSGIGVVGVKSAMATMYWWADRNGCEEDYMTEAVPDTADEFYHVDKLTFPNCDDDNEVVHWRIENWPHSWPGPSRNVYATAEIVEFFLRHELREEDIVLTPVLENKFEGLQPRPNPFSDQLDLSQLGAYLSADTGIYWQVFNSRGQLMTSGDLPNSVNTSDWPKGFYFLRVEGDGGVAGYKLVKN